MKFDYLNNNIYKSTEYAYANNLNLILPAALVLLLSETMHMLFDFSSSFSWILEMLLDFYVAYAFHTTVLNGTTSSSWREQFKLDKKKQAKQFRTFIRRSLAFFYIGVGISIVLALIVIMALPDLGAENPEEFAGTFSIIIAAIGLPFYGILFTLYGTALPATVSGADPSFSAAFRRAKGLYRFTFGRLLIGPVLFSIGMIVILLGLVKLDVPVSAFTDEGQFSVIGICISFLFYALQFFAIGLTATVLCKTYLRSLKNTDMGR